LFEKLDVAESREAPEAQFDLNNLHTREENVCDESVPTQLGIEEI